MRFHIGFSKRISWKWIVGAIGVIAAFFFGNHVVLAATSGTINMTPTAQGVYDYADSSTHNLTKSVGSSTYLGNRYYMNYSSATCGGGVACSPVYEGYSFWRYSATDFCPNKNKVTLTFKYFNRSSQTDHDFSSRNLSINGVWWTQVSSTFNSTGQFTTVTVTMDDDLPFEIRPGFNTSSYYYVSSGISQAFEYSCEYTLEESTTTIINNNNNNTQQIIDSQQQIIDSLTDDSVNSTTTNFANTIFGQDPFQNHGIQAIITAPISMLQGILNASTGTCQNLAVPVNLTGTDTATYLPCGSILWSRVPNTIEAIYQTTIYGFLIYFVLADIVRTVNNVLDPERKNDYVMDL